MGREDPKTTQGADIRHWDVAPPREYFDELARVSKNQVIWGGNYFDLPPTRCFLIWRKLNIPLQGFSMSPVEYAWTSFNDNAQAFECYSNAATGIERRIHPTQKPVALYAWIFQRYAKPGFKILDTHLGSGSSRIAAYDAGLDFVGCELDKVYFELEEERFARHAAQGNLFFELES
ncbi:MAG: site-specific DNA-methyltransferase [Oscillospiraceae bacterium]|nr:site-specific DNA-methyltransferase [Oscillospiraceae bacterium]